MTQEFEDPELPPEPERSVRNAYAAADLVDTSLEGGRRYPHFKVQKPLFKWEGSQEWIEEARETVRDHNQHLEEKNKPKNKRKKKVKKDDKKGKDGKDGKKGDDDKDDDDDDDGDGLDDRYTHKRSKFDHPFVVEACEPGVPRDAHYLWQRAKIRVRS